MFTLLFTHFGQRLPVHLIKNIDRTYSLFPKMQIVLVTDSLDDESFASPIRVISVDKLNLDPKRSKLERDERFWSGWWQKTFDRLLTIYPVHLLYPNSHILQIESDTILYPIFPFDSLLRIEDKISFPRYSTTSGIASLIHSPSVATSLLFEDAILEEVGRNPLTSDMLALGSFLENHPNDYLQLEEFPAEGREPAAPRVPGLFDGASHGEWITGRDPKAHWGIGLRKQRTPITSEMKMPQYSIRQGQLFAHIRGKDLPVNNLHIHSKESFFIDLSQEDKVVSHLSKLNSSVSSLRYFSHRAFLFCAKSRLLIWITSAFSLSGWRRLVLRLFQR